MLELPALLVDQVEETDVIKFASLEEERKHGLPTELIRPYATDPSQVAIVSWRWDTEQSGQPSRNLLSVIREAKKRKIRYLLLDFVSIRQDLGSKTLIKQVLAYSNLYETLPVIAAYDKVGEDLTKIMRRPWIAYEMHRYRNNPHKVIYIGHSDQGAAINPGWGTVMVLFGASAHEFRFERMLHNVWQTSFARTILGVLCDEIGMSFISDFKFILPKYAWLLDLAYEQMDRNDYLLTAAILCQIGVINEQVNWSADITKQQYSQYTMEIEKEEFCYSFRTKIRLGEAWVASWDYKYDDFKGTQKAHFSVCYHALETLEIISNALNVDSTSRPDDAGVADDIALKRPSMSRPPIEIVAVTL